MQYTKGLFLILAVIFIFNCFSVELMEGAQIEDIELQLIEEILDRKSVV